MPRGKYVNHKGRGRSFSSPEELAREQKDLKLRKKRQEEMGSDFEEEEEPTPEAAAAAAAAKAKAKAEGGSSTEEDSSSDEESDDENKKKKGVEGLIEIENPNRRVMKQKKLSKLEDTSKPASDKPSANAATGSGPPPELSRREREVIEKQRAKERYQKLHAEGKTEEARKDLARLAIIRKEREEAAAKKAALLAEKDAAKTVKQSELNKALGKK